MTPAAGTPTSSPRIAIIGAGPGGLAMAKRLLDEGFDDFVLLERNGGVGGTWYQNRYPGCECDVPSALYSFSFEFKVDWSKPYGRQPEILAYMEHVAEKYGILPHCRFGADVTRAEWDDAVAAWTLTLGDGETVEADVVVSAIGMFNDLAWPDIDGLDTFAGTSFHSARWDWDHDLTGETVAVIGSAASAVQFVPEIVKTAGQVHLFQRSANWVLPKPDEPYTEDQLEAFRRDPAPLLRVPGRDRVGHEQGHDLRRSRPERLARDGRSRRDRSGGGPGGPGQAPADPPVRLQAAPVRQHLLPRVQPAEPRARDGGASTGSPRTPWSPSTAWRGASTR